MKPYAQNYEPSNVRDFPDKGDIQQLGLSSKHGKQRSKNKRSVRRMWKKLARAASKVLLHKELDNR